MGNCGEEASDQRQWWGSGWVQPGLARGVRGKMGRACRPGRGGAAAGPTRAIPESSRPGSARGEHSLSPALPARLRGPEGSSSGPLSDRVKVRAGKRSPSAPAWRAHGRSWAGEVDSAPIPCTSASTGGAGGRLQLPVSSPPWGEDGTAPATVPHCGAPPGPPCCHVCLQRSPWHWHVWLGQQGRGWGAAEPKGRNCPRRPVLLTQVASGTPT